MTPETMTEAASYLAAVQAELGDLPPAVRDDLLEDLPAHFVEILADGGGTLGDRLGAPAAYAAELRAAAGLPARGVKPVGPSLATLLGVALRRRREQLRGWATGVPGGPEVVGFLPDLRPGWWVLRGYLLLAVPALLGLFGLGIGVAPVLTLFGSDLLGLTLTLGVIVASVRLGRRTDTLRPDRRALVALGNAALLVVALLGAGEVRGQVGYNGEVRVVNADTSYLQGPDGGISNIYAFDRLGRPLQGVQLFDQDGRPLDSLLLQAPDGSYAEPVRTLDEYGSPVLNAFPRTLRTEQCCPDGAPRTVEVTPPPISPRRLADPSPTPDSSVSPTPTPTPDPTASPAPTATQTPTPTPASPGATPSPGAAATPASPGPAATPASTRPAPSPR